MKGIIIKGIQDLVLDRFGPDTWEKVRERSGCDDVISVRADYPDPLTVDLVSALSSETSLPPEELMFEFGKFWILNTGRKTYPVFFQLAGKNARQFLKSMDRVHRQVTLNTPDAHPPRFEYEDTEDGRLIMHYQSERKLCAVMRGLIVGVGLYFNETLTVEETACMLKGDPRCTMEIRFHDR